MANDSRRVALITGGARGIGWSTALQLLTDGWYVAVFDRDPGNSPAAQHGGNALEIHTVDVRDRSAVRAAVDRVAGHWGHIDALVTSAGVQRHSPFENISEEDWDFVFSVNLGGAVAAMQAVAHHMLQRSRGSIVNISSITGFRGAPGRAPYAASKAAIISITKTAAVEWASRGIRVNAVAPGYIETDLVREFVTAGRIDTNPIQLRTPQMRMGNPDEIAQGICFLLSDGASYITGHTLVADGGFLADYGVPFNSPK